MTDPAAVTLACADYNRLMPLVSGAVRAEGVDLAFRLSEPGSWPSRAAMLRAALQDPAIAGGEASHGRAPQPDRSRRPLVRRLAVFVLRNFTARDLYVVKGSPITTVAHLAGKRVGCTAGTASGSIWYRHFLAWAGLDPTALHWCIGDIDGGYTRGSMQRCRPASPGRRRAAPWRRCWWRGSWTRSTARPVRCNSMPWTARSCGCCRITARGTDVLQGHRHVSRRSTSSCCGGRFGRRTAAWPPASPTPSSGARTPTSPPSAASLRVPLVRAGARLG